MKGSMQVCKVCGCIIYAEKCTVCGYAPEKEYDLVFEILNEPEESNKT